MRVIKNRWYQQKQVWTNEFLIQRLLKAIGHCQQILIRVWPRGYGVHSNPVQIVQIVQPLRSVQAVPDIRRINTDRELPLFENSRNVERFKRQQSWSLRGTKVGAHARSQGSWVFSIPGLFD